MIANRIEGNIEEIRRKLNAIEGLVSLQQDPDLAEQQVEYLLIRLRRIQSRLNEILLRPSRTKSYKTEIRFTAGEIKHIINEIELWALHNIEPDLVKIRKDIS